MTIPSFITGGIDTQRSIHYTVLPGESGCVECWRRSAEANDPTVVPFPTPAYDPDADRFTLTAQGLAALAAMTDPTA